MGAMKTDTEKVNEAQEDLSAPTMLTSKQVAARMDISVRTLWRLLAANKIPQPVRFNRKLVRWRLSDLKAARI